VPATNGIPKLLLSTPEVAHALGVSERFVKQLIYAGTLPSLKVGRLRRVPAGELHIWIEGQRAAGPSRGVE
jgi:excisionase family DNA binding protein